MTSFKIPGFIGMNYEVIGDRTSAGKHKEVTA
jgi:hypothetical protein